MGPSSAGALGYCQFMPATWAHYGVDGDGDGVADPSNYRDCLPAAAQLLLASGAPGDLRRALYAYNHSWAYVDHVLSIAASYGYLDPAGIPAQAVALARSRIGSPYVWGAAGPDSFDCSGLTQWVYAQLGISLAAHVTGAVRRDDARGAGVPAAGRPPLLRAHLPLSERITHVGIYAGNGVVIMATQPGDFVKEVSLDDPYWARHFASAGRPVKGPQRMTGGRGVMVILGGLAALLLVIAIVSGWQGANRLRGQGEGMSEVEEAARLFVEAYGTFDFREPDAYRERLLSLSTGDVHAAIARIAGRPDGARAAADDRDRARSRSRSPPSRTPRRPCQRPPSRRAAPSTRRPDSSASSGSGSTSPAGWFASTAAGWWPSSGCGRKNPFRTPADRRPM